MSVGIKADWVEASSWSLMANDPHGHSGKLTRGFSSILKKDTFWKNFIA